MAGLVCWRCGKSLKDIPLPFTRLQQCKHCHADLHVCRLCRFYNPAVSEKCNHDLAEPARDIELANFCQYFKPVSNAFNEKNHGREEDAMARLKSLFGDDAQDATADSYNDDTKTDYEKAKDKFDALFRKDD